MNTLDEVLLLIDTLAGDRLIAASGGSMPR
jgi:hypothetical protein